MNISDRLNVSSERLDGDLQDLAGVIDTSKPGFTRTALSEVYRDGMSWIASKMKSAGLEVEIDVAGNVIGTLRGQHEGAALVSGSHIDTVDAGGRYDGIVGVIGAVEAVRAMREAGIKLDHPLKVIAFFGEEANEFGLAHVGSRAIGGTLTTKHLMLTNAAGQTFAEGLRERTGIDPDRMLSARWTPDDMAAYVELHIEQGAILEEHGRSLGLVTGIAGARRFVASLTGRPDHAGATPMDRRHDAFCGAAQLALSVEHFAKANPGGVATIGNVAVSPGASNVVPGLAELFGDMRSLDTSWLDARALEIADAARKIGEARGLKVAIAWPSITDPTLFANPVQRLIGSVLNASGHDFIPITSGAGHDAQEMARLGPAGMIFVPSHNGRSHCPEEHTDLADIAIGVQALAESLLALDKLNRSSL